jgi:heme exporter protein B
MLKYSDDINIFATFLSILNILKYIYSHIKKDFLLEFRSPATISGIIVYLVATVFVASNAFLGDILPATWNGLFWIIFLFAAINGTTKTFIETQGKQLYHYTLFNPIHVIVSKIIYNSLLLIVLGFLAYFIFSVFIGNQVQNHVLMLSTIFFGAIGLAGMMSLVGAIAAQTNGQFGMMALMVLPICLPLLSILIKLSKMAQDDIAWSVIFKYLSGLFLLDVITIALAYLLFPYLWRR